MASGSKGTTDAKATEDDKLEAMQAGQGAEAVTEKAGEGAPATSEKAEEAAESGAAGAAAESEAADAAKSSEGAAERLAQLSPKLAKKAAKKAKRAAEKAAEEEAAAAAAAEREEKASVPTARRSAVFVGVILVSVIMVGSCLLPSLSAIISGIQNAQESAETSSATEDASDDAETDSDTERAETTNSYMDSLDETYQPKVDALESKLEENAEDKATLINLANTYLKWADTGRNYASSDTDTEHVNELLTKAEGYYDSYLKLDDASAARVSRALCQYYLGETDAAVAALKEVAEKDESYAPAWTNLGMVYDETGDTEKAKEAFNKALEVDPNDTYGLQSYASSQLSSIESEEEAATTAEASE